MRINAGGLSELVLDREKEIQTLNAYIELGQHCAVIGPRRYGKTTLINHVLDEIQNDYFIVKLDIFNASSIRELCLLFVDEVYKSHGIANFIKSAKDGILDFISKFSLEIQDVKLGYDALREHNDELLIQNTFELAEIFAIKRGKKAIVFFDEFGDMERFGIDSIKKMRSIFQKHKNTIYIFAGSQASTMNNIFLDRDNAFFNFASIMKIGKLSDEAISSFLTNLEIKSNTFGHDAVDIIQNTVNGHPFYLMKLVQEAYIASVLRGTDNTVNSDDVANAIDKILYDNKSYFEMEWGKVNAKKHKGLVLKELVDVEIDQSVKISLSYKSQLLKELKDQTIVDDDKKFVDVFFELWLRREFDSSSAK